MNINQIISNYNQLKYSISEPVKLKILRYFFASKYENFKGNEPLISVYVPTFNRSKILIDRAVTSVLEQSYKNFEFVIVGDICTDNTEQQLKKINDKTNNNRTLYMNKVASEFSADEKNSYTGFSSFLEKNKIIELNTLLTSSPYIIHFDRTFDSKNNIKIL